MYMLIFFSLLIATGFVIAFVWAINSGQFDDKFTPSVRILFDDVKSDTVTKEQNSSERKSKTGTIKTNNSSEEAGGQSSPRLSDSASEHDIP